MLERNLSSNIRKTLFVYDSFGFSDTVMRHSGKNLIRKKHISKDNSRTIVFFQPVTILNQRYSLWRKMKISMNVSLSLEHLFLLQKNCYQNTLTIEFNLPLR